MSFVEQIKLTDCYRDYCGIWSFWYCRYLPNCSLCCGVLALSLSFYTIMWIIMWINLFRRSTILVCLFFHATIDWYLGPFCCKTSALAEFYMWPGACTLVSIYYEVATAFCARNKIAALANFSALWYLPTFIIFSFPNVLSAEGSELLAFIFIANNTSSSFSSSSLCLSVTLIEPF